MTGKKKTDTSRPIEYYEHRDKRRVKNPPLGLVTPEPEPHSSGKKTCAYDQMKERKA